MSRIGGQWLVLLDIINVIPRNQGMLVYAESILYQSSNNMVSLITVTTKSVSLSSDGKH